MEATIEYETVSHILSGRIVENIKRPFYKVFMRENLKISPEQYAILDCLSRQNMITQQTLCDLTKKDKPNVTRLLDRLEDKKLVQRMADGTDKRKKRICITDQGLSMYEKVNQTVIETLMHAVRNIEEGKLIIFQDVLRHMIANIS